MLILGTQEGLEQCLGLRFWELEKEGVSMLGLHCVEKAMATHSSTLAWKIPWMEEPGRLQSMGSLRVRHE